MPSADRVVYESTAAKNRFVANAKHLLKKYELQETAWIKTKTKWESAKKNNKWLPTQKVTDGIAAHGKAKVINLSYTQQCIIACLIVATCMHAVMTMR